MPSLKMLLFFPFLSWLLQFQFSGTQQLFQFQLYSMHQDAKLNTFSDDIKKGTLIINEVNFDQDQSESADLSKEKSGHWNDRQNAKYFAFLDKFKDRFMEKESRRQCKIFKELSRFIRTRNANQCRSHHHKMKKNFKTIQQTLWSLRKKNPFLEAESKKYIQELSNIKIHTTLSQQPKKQLNQQQNPKRSSSNLQQEGLKYRIYSGQPQKMKTLDFSNFPTQVSYIDQGEMNVGSNNYFNNYQQNSFRVLSQSKTSDRYNPAYLEPQQRMRENGWLQCHEIFTRWFNKVKTLMN